MIVNKRTDKIKVSLKDTSGNDVGTENGRLKTSSVNLTSNELLSLILKELKIIRLHQEKASNEIFLEQDT